MKVAFLANSFHLKRTKSADFFIELLRGHFESVTVIPHKEAWAELAGRAWDLIVVWQHRYAPQELEAFGAKRVVLIPMYDDTPLSEDFWAKYRKFKVFCFSATLQRVLVSYGLTAWGARYYPDPEPLPRADWSRGLRGFFWPRTEAIDVHLVRRLMGTASFQALHVHLTPELSNHLGDTSADSEKRDDRVEVSSWFADAGKYHATLARANVFFASRTLEGIGMSYLEAMAMGLCVVAPAAPTMNEYIHHGVDGLLYDPSNLQPLDFSTAMALGAAARQSCVQGRTAWVAASDRVAAFLEEPAPGYTPKFHPVIMMRGRGTAVARKAYRFMKRITRRTP